MAVCDCLMNFPIVDSQLFLEDSSKFLFHSFSSYVLKYFERVSLNRRTRRVDQRDSRSNPTDYFDLGGWYYGGSCTRDCSSVVLLRETGTNRHRGLASPFFLHLPVPFLRPISLPRCQPSLFPLCPSTVLSSHATSRKRGLRLSGTGTAWSTYNALLSVNYLLIILFILAATTPPLSAVRGQRNFTLRIIRQCPRQKWICIDLQDVCDLPCKRRPRC